MTRTFSGTEFDRQVGRRVRAIRLRMGLTQPELASKLGISKERMASVEVGRYNLSAEVLYLIAKVLKRKMEDFCHPQSKMEEKETKKNHNEFPTGITINPSTGKFRYRVGQNLIGTFDSLDEACLARERYFEGKTNE